MINDPDDCLIEVQVITEYDLLLYSEAPTCVVQFEGILSALGGLSTRNECVQKVRMFPSFSDALQRTVCWILAIGHSPLE